MAIETPAERVDRWLTILDAVRREIYGIYHHREIWDFFNTELPKQPDSGIVHAALARWYVDSQAAAIRRIYEAKDKRSLGALLKSLEAHPSELTRTDYLKLWHQLSEPNGDEHGVFRRMANDTYDGFAGPGGAHLDPQVVAADRERLKAAAHKVARWADENVAHIGRKGSVTVTFGELDEARSFSSANSSSATTCFLTEPDSCRSSPRSRSPGRHHSPSPGSDAALQRSVKASQRFEASTQQGKEVVEEVRVVGPADREVLMDALRGRPDDDREILDRDGEFHQGGAFVEACTDELRGCLVGSSFVFRDFLPHLGIAKCGEAILKREAQRVVVGQLDLTPERRDLAEFRQSVSRRLGELCDVVLGETSVTFVEYRQEQILLAAEVRVDRAGRETGSGRISSRVPPS